MNLGLVLVLGGVVLGAASFLGFFQVVMESSIRRLGPAVASLVGLSLSAGLFIGGFILIGIHLSQTVPR